MKRIITAIAVLLAAAWAAGAQSFEGTFKQTKTLTVTGKTFKSEGTITYTAPDQLAMLYTKPEGDYFIIDGRFLRLDLKGVALDVDTETNKTVRPQRNAILYGIQGKYEEIAQEMDADCTVSQNKDGSKHVVIKVRKTLPKGYSGMELDYKKNGQVSRMVLEEFGGISTEYLLNVK